MVILVETSVDLKLNFTILVSTLLSCYKTSLWRSFPDHVHLEHAH